MTRLLILILALFGCVDLCPEVSQSNAPAVAEPARATRGVQVLQGWYDESTGLYRTTGWWNAANAITVLVDYARVGGTGQYNGVLANTYVAAQKQAPNFLNNFYDDEGWWALAWIDAYDLTGDARYLAMAKTIFGDMTKGWDGTCGGGIWWSKDRGYKNAIANELFLSVAAHLSNRDPSRSFEYLGWAKREWTWFAHSGMINGQDLVNDGLGTKHGHTAAGACGNNGQTTWTYNQGVVLGGLMELSRLDHDPALLQTAEKIAAAAITHLVDSHGVLHDACEPHCGADGVQFKGIFVRNLVQLANHDPNPDYRTFVLTNADSIWQHARGPRDELGEVWSGPPGDANAATQSSAMDAIIAAAALKRKQ